MKRQSILLFCFFILTASAKKSKGRSLRGLGQPWERPLDCVMVQSHTEVSNQLKDEEYWECEDAQGRIIDFQNVQYSSEFKDPRVGTLESGKTIFHGLVESQSDSTVVVNKVLGFSSPDDSSHRRLATTGTRSVLLVRIKASDAETTPSESDLANKVFGVGSEDSFNLVSGYDQCSYGKLKLIPTDEVQNGVYTLELDMEVIGEKSTDIRSAAIEKLRTDMGVSNLNDKFDHVAFCLPPGTKSKYGATQWSASAIINGYITLFNDNWCTSTSAMMHEIGHNLGLRHSNQDGEYQDLTGMMGYSYLVSGRPIMCFNTAKNYELGWYEDRHATLDPLQENFWEGDLIGYADYENSAASPGSSVILKIEGHNKNYFVGFNRKAGINRQNQESEATNRVTVHSVGTSIVADKSELEAKLATGESFEIPFFGDTEYSVLINVENIDLIANPGIARVSVTYLKCTSDADCDDGSSCTTNTCNLSTGTCVHTPKGHCDEFLEVVLLTDAYPEETSWTIVDNCNNNDIIMSGGDYKNRYTTYTDSKNVPRSQYTFEIKDGYGDGICCNQGKGSFMVNFADVTVAQGAEFGRALKQTWGSCPVETPDDSPTVSPTSSPTACELAYTLTFTASASTYWMFAYGEEVALVARQSSEVYQNGVEYTESGCLHSNCYQFIIENASSYSLVVEDSEFAHGYQIIDPEISLFGTCRPILEDVDM